jgi:3,4-dihydroxy 2-butanone 4-phosphate synthase / GTP cyclohydrolase II
MSAEQAVFVDEERPFLRRVGEASLPTDHGRFRCVAFQVDAVHHLALVAGQVAFGEDVLVRVHSECLTGDVFGSRRCDCGAQLERAMGRIGAEEFGVIIYLRGHEGRGIGIGPKLQAYELQELGLDTVDANVELGYPVDCRDYAAAAWILADLGVRSVRLLTNNPAKCAALAANGIPITDRVPLTGEPTAENLQYLRTKRARLGHLLDGLDGLDNPAVTA